MGKIFLDQFHGQRRNELVKKCIEFLSKGMKAVYILPSREAMFHVRRLFIEEFGGLFNCFVIGFDDFEKLILKDFVSKNKVLGDYEASIILKSVLRDISPDSIFNLVKEKPGFIQGLQMTIRNLKRLDLSPEVFNQKTAAIEGITGFKCRAFCEIFRKYEMAKSEEDLFDVDDLSMLAIDHIVNSDIIKNCGIIVIDGFVNIDPVNIRLIKGILDTKPEIDICVNIPFHNDNNMDFLNSEIIKDIINLGFEMDNRGTPHNHLIHQSLSDLSSNLYSGNPHVEFRDPVFYISESPCLDHEVRETARRIKTLILDDGVKPDDIAIFCNNSEEYSGKISDVFIEYGIPLYGGSMRRLTDIPLIKDLMCLFGKDVAGFEASGFYAAVSSKYLLPVKLLQESGFESDSYFNTASYITGRFLPGQYFKAFQEAIKNNNENCEKELEPYLNIVEGFNPQKYDGPADALRAFCEVLNSIRVEKHIHELFRNGILTPEIWIRDLVAYKDFIALLEKMVLAWGGIQTLDNDEWFDALIRELQQLTAATQTGVKSRDFGGVKLLSPDLARGQNYNTVFILGLNEGIFPCVGTGNVLFELSETATLYGIGINMGEPLWELQREMLRFNACVAAAGSRLYISYRTADEDGSLLIPSPFLDEILSCLTKESTARIKPEPVSMRQRMKYCINPASHSEALKKLNVFLWNHEGGNKVSVETHKDNFISVDKEQLRFSVQAARMELSRSLNPEYDRYDGRLSSPRLAQQDANYGFSVSQLNSFVRCPFQYFAERVLDLSEKEEEPLGAKSMGTFYHSILKAYHEGNSKPEEADTERLKNILRDQWNELDYGNVPPVVIELIKEEIEDVLEAFIILDAENLHRYNNTTGFRLKPVMLEQPFEMLMLNGGNIVRGIADRVDLEMDKSGKYTGRFIIYDYKKGGIKGLKECIEGVDFQLPLYHSAFYSLLREKYGIDKPQCLALLYYSIGKLEWKGIIRKDMKPALFESRKRPQLIDPNNMAVLMEWVENEAENTISYIREGRFMPPLNCPAGIWGCYFSGMCRYDRFRLERKEA